MKNFGYTFLILVILLVIIAIIAIFRRDVIQQCSLKYDGDTPPMLFITSFIDSFTPADCRIIE